MRTGRNNVLRVIGWTSSMNGWWDGALGKPDAEIRDVYAGYVYRMPLFVTTNTFIEA
jgi:hypothetical protein